MRVAPLSIQSTETPAYRRCWLRPGVQGGFNSELPDRPLWRGSCVMIDVRVNLTRCQKVNAITGGKQRDSSGVVEATRGPNVHVSLA